MNILDWIRGIVGCPSQVEIDELKSELENTQEELALSLKNAEEAFKVIEDDDIKIEELNKELNELKDTDSELDKYCQAHFKEIPKIAYTQKRVYQGNSVTISLHELVTPDSWEVFTLFKRIDKTGDIRDVAQRIGDVTAKNIAWTSDSNLSTSNDYYLYPNETITSKKGDCEDHTFINMSAHEELGGAWGFFGTVGHAFNVFVKNDDLFILDTVGAQSDIELYKEDSEYKIHYIITKNHAYQVKGGISFGNLAGWN